MSIAQNWTEKLFPVFLTETATFGCLARLFIPQSVEFLDGDWAVNTLLMAVIFESAASLGEMMMDSSADLNSAFEIEILVNGSELDFPGIVVDSRPDCLIRFLRR
jgi:hypothetical protein